MTYNDWRDLYICYTKCSLNMLIFVTIDSNHIPICDSLTILLTSCPDVYPNLCALVRKKHSFSVNLDVFEMFSRLLIG
jgi:hypothetical protein